MKEDERIVEQLHVILVNELLLCLLCKDRHFILERCSPRDAILFLFLNVLDGHVRRVVEERNEALHESLAELPGFDTFVSIDLQVDEAL